MAKEEKEIEVVGDENVTVEVTEQEPDPPAPKTHYEENGKIIIYSPLAEYPGVIVVKKNLDPFTVINVLKRADNLPKVYQGDDVPFVLREFWVRFPIFDFQLEGLSIKEKDVKAGTGFPAQLAARCVNATVGIFDRAFDLKN